MLLAAPGCLLLLLAWLLLAFCPLLLLLANFFSFRMLLAPLAIFELSVVFQDMLQDPCRVMKAVEW